MTAMVIAVVLSGSLAAAAVAQDEPAFSFSNVQLWVNPEYDDPSLLVMLEGTLTSAAPPVTVAFLVPTGAVMYSRGSKDASGSYNVGPNDTRNASSIPGWDIVSYTLESNIFRIEYYDNSAIVGSPDKTVDYEFRTLTPITNMSVYVQQPRTATNFVVDPAGAANLDGQGFTIQTYSYPTVDPATPVDFHITYTKTDSAPSLGDSGASSGGTSGGSSSGGLSNGVVVIIVVVVVAAAAVIIFMTQRSRPVNRADRRRRTGAARRPQAVSRSSGGGNRGGGGGGGNRGGGGGGGGGGTGKFCTNCGAPVSSNARFCSECGTQRK